MPERVYQLDFFSELPRDVTPKGRHGIRFRREVPLSRFVREVGEGYRIRSPGDAATYFMERVYTPFEEFNQEELWVLLLDNKNRVTHEVMVYRGTRNTIAIRTAELLREAVRHDAVTLVAAHNHPSGDPTPSPEDIRTTRELRQASELLDIDLLDHVIVGKSQYVSMKERGLGF